MLTSTTHLPFGPDPVSESPVGSFHQVGDTPMTVVDVDALRHSAQFGDALLQSVSGDSAGMPVGSNVAAKPGGTGPIALAFSSSRCRYDDLDTRMDRKSVHRCGGAASPIGPGCAYTLRIDREKNVDCIDVVLLSRGSRHTITNTLSLSITNPQ